MIDPMLLQSSAFELFNNFLATVVAIVFIVTGIGAASGSLAVGSYVGYLAFLYLAVETGDQLLTNIAYTTLVLVFIGFAFKFWRLEAGGET